MEALDCVDQVIIFDEDTPLQLIEQIQPDILVKGGDYTTDQIVGADFIRKIGGKVITIDVVHDVSTSKIISTLIND